MGNKRVSQALFRSIGSSGIDWLFVASCDGGWAIIRDGTEIDIGTGKPSSVIRGIDKFLSLARLKIESTAAFSPEKTEYLENCLA